jgi:heme exporter protein A
MVLFDDLNLSLASGEIMQIVGPNGSGKTSLLRILSGLAQTTEGKVMWNDLEISDSDANYVNEISYVGHQNGIKSALTPLENLNFSAALYNTLEGASPAQALKEFGLYGYEDTPVSKLSSGQRRRVALARLLLTHAHLWLLDEPYTSVDDKGRTFIAKVLTEHLDKHGMIIIVSHEPVTLEGIDIKQVRLGRE